MRKSSFALIQRVGKTLGSLSEPAATLIFYRSDVHRRFHLFGGKSEDNETPIATLARELKEEIGIDSRFIMEPNNPAVELAGKITTTYNNEQWEETFYNVYPTEDDLRDWAVRHKLFHLDIWRGKGAPWTTRAFFLDGTGSLQNGIVLMVNQYCPQALHKLGGILPERKPQIDDIQRRFEVDDS